MENIDWNIILRYKIGRLSSDSMDCFPGYFYVIIKKISQNKNNMTGLI